MKGKVLDRFASVQTAYRRTCDAFKIAHFSVRVDSRAGRRTRFAASTDREVDAEFDAMHHRLADATVVNLWVVFERFLIEHVSESVVARASLSQEFQGLLQAKVVQEVERWRFDEILDLYKGSVDSNEIGKAKQIKSYRDWVAHQNPRRAPSARIGPEAAYRLLVAIVRSIVESGPS